MARQRPVVARVGAWQATLASVEIVNALGATIAYRLEPVADAVRFPTLLAELWKGRLDAGRAAAALAELAVASAELADLAPDKAVWSIADLRRVDDTNLPVDHSARNLAEYFVALDGRPLLAVLREALEEAQLQNVPLLMDSWVQRESWRSGALLTAVGAVGWAVSERFFPDVIVTPSRAGWNGTPRHGLLLSAVFLIVWVLGLFSLVVARFPRLENWASGRSALLGLFGVLALAAIVAWGWR